MQLTHHAECASAAMSEQGLSRSNHVSRCDRYQRDDCCAQREQCVACENARAAIPEDAREASDQANEAEGYGQVNTREHAVNGAALHAEHHTRHERWWCLEASAASIMACMTAAC
jgi:hypothetical protein